LFLFAEKVQQKLLTCRRSSDSIIDRCRTYSANQKGQKAENLLTIIVVIHSIDYILQTVNDLC